MVTIARGFSQSRDRLYSQNRIPAYCEFCGGDLTPGREEGVFICVDCQAENFDDFHSIHNYLLEKGPRSVMDIERDLKIPRRIINDYWKHHR